MLKIRVGIPVLLHQQALPAVFQIDVVRIEITFGRYDHDLRHCPANARGYSATDSFD